MRRKLIWIVVILFIALCAYYFWPEKNLDTSHKIDRILVVKHERKLIVFSGNEPLKTYRISLGKVPVGKKGVEGDMKTPEGRYFIHDKNPNSGYHLNLGISYPNEMDKEHANALHLSPGGQIKIHGLKNGLGFIGKFHRFSDWTNGCIAVTNKEIEELYQNVPIGTVIEIVE